MSDDVEQRRTVSNGVGWCRTVSESVGWSGKVLDSLRLMMLVGVVELLNLVND